MSDIKQKVTKMLSATVVLIKHQKKIEKLKGESFNVFSILKMERLEEKTHSNFINELLNPNGSHLMGDVFLKLFLKTLNIENYLETAKASSKTEVYLGAKDLENQKGGRIDILIKDKKGYSISIENKIDAGDQEAQLVRYSKYNTEKNKLYYLNLFGSVAHETSVKILDDLGEEIIEDGKVKMLERDTDYFVISYNVEIIEWLQLCIKEAVNEPILRESIKQYYILIRKITNTMSNEDEKELQKIILKDIKAARFIYNNYATTIQALRTKFRDDLKQTVVDKLKLKKLIYFHENGNVIQSVNSPVWFKHSKEDKFYFGIEPFSGNRKSFSKGDLMMGICNDSGLEIKDSEKYEYKSEFWMHHQMITFEGKDVHLEDSELLENLANDKAFFKEIIEQLSNAMVEMIMRYDKDLKKLNESNL